MTDWLTVLRKELFDVFAERHALRGILLQTAILIFMTGVFVPLVAGGAAAGDAGVLATLYVFFPAMLASSLAADAFAGERERKTLETLLATPLSDAAIVLGKAASAVIYAAAASAISALASQITALAQGRPAPLLAQPLTLAALVLGTVGASLVTCSIAIAVSMWIAVVRPAQQMSVIAAAALTFLSPYLMRHLGFGAQPAAMLRADVLLVTIGVTTLLIARSLFRRDRFFEKR